jgi:hypothetical protein
MGLEQVIAPAATAALASEASGQRGNSMAPVDGVSAAHLRRRARRRRADQEMPTIPTFLMQTLCRLDPQEPNSEDRDQIAAPHCCRFT